MNMRMVIRITLSVLIVLVLFDIVRILTSPQLHRLCVINNIDAVSKALEAGSDPNRKVVGELPIHLAAQYGRAEIMKMLISHGSYFDSLDLDDETPLLKAIKVRNSECINILLDAHADINKAGGRLADKQSPLHYGVRYGDLSIVELLVKQGADLEKRDDSSDTPLNIARSLGKRDISSFLENAKSKK